MSATEKAGKTKQIELTLPPVHWNDILDFMIVKKALLGPHVPVEAVFVNAQGKALTVHSTNHSK